MRLNYVKQIIQLEGHRLTLAQQSRKRETWQTQGMTCKLHYDPLNPIPYFSSQSSSLEDSSNGGDYREADILKPFLQHACWVTAVNKDLNTTDNYILLFAGFASVLHLCVSVDTEE